MTTNNPITPPPELVEQWRNLPEYISQLRTMSTVTITTEKLQSIATQAALWGADQQLEQDAEWLDTNAIYTRNLTVSPSGDALRQVMRPKPSSLAEDALEEINLMEGAMYSADLGCDFTATRRALERLQELENNG